MIIPYLYYTESLKIKLCQISPINLEFLKIKDKLSVNNGD